MRNLTALLLSGAAAASLALTSTPPAQARQQDWPLPPSSIVLSHVDGTMSTGFYIEGHRYGIPVAFTLPRIGIIRNQTCGADLTGACDTTWTAFYRTLVAFRDAAAPATSKTPARTAPVVTPVTASS